MNAWFAVFHLSRKKANSTTKTEMANQAAISRKKNSNKKNVRLVCWIVVTRIYTNYIYQQIE